MSNSLRRSLVVGTRRGGASGGAAHRPQRPNARHVSAELDGRRSQRGFRGGGRRRLLQGCRVST